MSSIDTKLAWLIRILVYQLGPIHLSNSSHRTDSIRNGHAEYVRTTALAHSVHLRQRNAQRNEQVDCFFGYGRCPAKIMTTLTQAELIVYFVENEQFGELKRRAQSGLTMETGSYLLSGYLSCPIEKALSYQINKTNL